MTQSYEGYDEQEDDGILDDMGPVAAMKSQLEAMAHHNKIVEWAKTHPWVVAGLGGLTLASVGFVSSATLPNHAR